MKRIFIVILFSVLFAQNEDTIKTTQNVSLVATSNVFAEYYDCGCPKAPLGGMARKAFFFKNMMSERKPILVDAGNTFFSHGIINPDGLRANQKKVLVTGLCLMRSASTGKICATFQINRGSQIMWSGPQNRKGKHDTTALACLA